VPAGSREHLDDETTLQHGGDGNSGR
jgi:hypothetical protein